MLTYIVRTNHKYKYKAFPSSFETVSENKSPSEQRSAKWNNIFCITDALGHISTVFLVQVPDTTNKTSPTHKTTATSRTLLIILEILSLSCRVLYKDLLDLYISYTTETRSSRDIFPFLSCRINNNCCYLIKYLESLLSILCCFKEWSKITWSYVSLLFFIDILYQLLGAINRFKRSCLLFRFSCLLTSY